MKNQQATLLLAAILAAPAFAVADNIPGHSKSENNYVTFSEGLTDQQDLQGNSARCIFFSGSTGENRSQTNSIAGASLRGMAKSESVNLVDFGDHQGASSDKDEGRGRGKHGGASGGGNGSGSGDGNGSGSGGGVSSPVIFIAEPGSQKLLLFGLAGLGMLFYRRKTLKNTI